MSDTKPSAMVIGTFDSAAREYLTRISQAAPLELFSSPKVYYTKPDETLTQDSLLSFTGGSDAMLVYAGHQYLYNENTGLTEFCVFMRPLTPRQQDLGEFEPGTYDPDYTPYFAWVHDPMRSSRSRSFCNALGQTLFADRFTMRVTLTPVPSDHILALAYNPAAGTAKLRRI